MESPVIIQTATMIPEEFHAHLIIDVLLQDMNDEEVIVPGLNGEEVLAQEE